MEVDCANSPFSDQLEPGEIIIWHGQPSPEAFKLHERSMRLRAAALIGIITLVGMALLAGSVSWKALVFVGIMTPVCLSFAMSSPDVEEKRSTMWYGLMNQRLLQSVLEDGELLILSIPLHRVSNIRLRSSGSDSHMSSAGIANIRPRVRGFVKYRIEFVCVADARSVVTLIEQSKRAV